MTFWLDAQLPPALARHLTERFGVEAKTLRSLGMRDASDREIFDAAKRDGADIITKDGDFVELVERLGAPPRIVWVTCGNSSNQHLKQVFETTFVQAQALLLGGASVVEIGDLARET